MTKPSWLVMIHKRRQDYVAFVAVFACNIFCNIFVITFAMKAMGRTVSAAPNCSVHISRVDRLCTEETTKRVCQCRTRLSLLVANILKLLDRIAATLRSTACGTHKDLLLIRAELRDPQFQQMSKKMPICSETKRSYEKQQAYTFALLRNDNISVYRPTSREALMIKQC